MTYDANGIRMSKLRVNHIDIVDSSYIYDSNGRLRTETEGAYTRRYLYSSDGEIISRKTIESCIDAPDRETYRIVVDGRNVGGVILKINNETHHNELEILFVSPEEHTKGIGYGAWQAVEKLHPETEVWETCTPYFEKRNIHFYVNKCGFQIDQFWCEYFQPDHELPDTDERNPDEGPDEMFRFVKVMKH